MSAKISHKNQSLSDIILLTLLGILLFFPPYFQGLYFDRQFQYYHMATALVFIIFLVVNPRSKNYTQSHSILDIPVVLLLIAYMLSLTAALNIYDAIGEVFRYFNYAMIFFMAARFSDKDEIKRIIQVLYFSGVGVAVVGLGAAFGLVKVPGGYEFNQIASTLGYSNSLGGYLIPVIILGSYLFVQDSDLRIKHLYSTGNYLAAITFIGTSSRGAFAVLPFVIILFCLLAGKGTGKEILKNIIFLFIVALVFSSKVIKLGLPVGRGSSILWLFAGLLLVNVLAYFFIRFKVGELGKSRTKLLLPVAGVLIIAAGVYIYVNVKSSTAFSFLPTQVVQKFSSTGFSSRNVQERFVFYKDAWKIVRDNPLLGTGGGGWAAVYTKYQSYLYSTTKVHSHLLQIAVDTGALGIIAYIVLWASLIVVIWRLLKSAISEEERLIIAALSASVAGILLHGLIDFDLSLGSISVLMWTLIAILSSYARRYNVFSRNVVNKNWVPILIKTISVISAIALLLISISFAAAFSYAKKGSAAIDNRVLPEAVKNYELAFKLNPLKGSYAADAAQSLHYLGDPVDNFNMVRQAKKYAVSAVKLDPYNDKIRVVKAKIQLSLSEIPEAVHEYEVARDIAPYGQQEYDNLVEVYFKVGKYYTLKGQKEEARKYFEKAAQVPSMVNNQLQKLNPKYREFWVIAPMLKVSPTIDKYAKEAQILLNRS